MVHLGGRGRGVSHGAGVGVCGPDNVGFEPKLTDAASGTNARLNLGGFNTRMSHTMSDQNHKTRTKKALLGKYRQKQKVSIR